MIKIIGIKILSEPISEGLKAVFLFLLGKRCFSMIYILDSFREFLQNFSGLLKNMEMCSLKAFLIAIFLTVWFHLFNMIILMIHNKHYPYIKENK